MLDPLIHVHSPSLYFHKSLSFPTVPVESSPWPPKSQTFPDASIQIVGDCRPPGTLFGSAKPWVPYVPGWLITFDPPIHVHSAPLYFHKSLRYPYDDAESPKPYPPKSQRSPVASIQLTAPTRPPGTLVEPAVP